MGKAKAGASEAKAAKAQAEVDGYVHAAVLRAATEGGPFKLQSAKDKTDGLFPAGPPKPVKAAIQAATTGDEPLFGSSGSGKAAVYTLTPAGVRATGKAVEHVAQTLSAADAIREAERVLVKLPDAVVELEPLIAKLTERQREEAEREAKQRQADAERQQQVLEALRRYQAGIEQRKQARVAELKRELAALGEAGDSPTPAVKAAAVPAPKDAREFVRQEARRLVGAWTDAVRLGKAEARLALEVVLGNLSAIEPIGEDGEGTAFDPVHHESETAVSKGAGVTVVLSGWRLVEDGGAEYVVAKAKVKPGG